jgi:hypothetical protein
MTMMTFPPLILSSLHSSPPPSNHCVSPWTVDNNLS